MNPLTGMVAKSAGNIPESTMDAIFMAMHDFIAGRLAQGKSSHIPGIGWVLAEWDGMKMAVRFVPDPDLQGAAETGPGQ